MPIEFNCKNCGRAMRTPDGTAGKKGRCPGCGSIQDIPARPRPEASPSPARQADGIEFHCPACKALVRTPASAAGKKGKCPHCGGLVQIPAGRAAGGPAAPAPGSTAARARPAAGGAVESAAQSRSAPKRQRFADGPSRQAGVVVKDGTMEFPCTACGATMRTPLSAAGKKGRCSSCGEVSQIPNPKPAPRDGTSSATPAAGSSSPTVKGGLTELPARPATGPSPKKGGLTELPSSPSGGAGPQKLTPLADTKPSSSGAMADGLLTELPDPAAKAAPAAAGGASKGGAAPPWAKKKAETGESTIRFHCPNCQKQVTTPAATAGKKGQCPHCNKVMVIPTADEGPGDSSVSPSSRGPSRASSGLAPPGGGLAELTALDAVPGPAGLTPLDAGGLQPLDSATGGLQPLDSVAGGLAPLGGGGLTPLDGGLAPVGGAADLSAGDWTAAAPAKAGSRYSGPRNGLPWERGAKSSSKFFATGGKVMFSPSAAFGMMKRRGGIGAALGYAVSGGLILAGLITLAFAVLIAIGLTFGLSLGGASAEQAGFAVGGAVLYVLVVLVSSTFQAAIGAIIHTFLTAGILHLLLMAVGGANQSFETTYRVVAYTYGSLIWLVWIPILNVAIVVGYPILLGIGLAAGHETSGGKAAAAVLMPLGACCILLTPFLFFFGGGLLEILGQMGR